MTMVPQLKATLLKPVFHFLGQRHFYPFPIDSPIDFVNRKVNSAIRFSPFRESVDSPLPLSFLGDHARKVNSASYATLALFTK